MNDQLPTVEAPKKKSINSLFGSNESRLMNIRDADGALFENTAGKVMGIMLTDTESEACKAVIAAHRKKHKKHTPSAAAQEEFGLALLTAATTGFVNLEDDSGDVAFSPDIAFNLYKSSRVVRKQVDEFVGADENFIKGVLAA